MAEKDDKQPITAYTIVSSLSILVTLVFLVGTIVIQSTFGYSEETGYTFPQTIGILFSSSALPIVCLSNTYEASTMSATSAIVSMCLGVIMIILSSYAARGSNWALWSSLGIAAADTICMIPLFVLSATGDYAITLRAQDYAMQAVFHALLLGLLIAAVILKIRMDKAKKPKVHE